MPLSSSGQVSAGPKILFFFQDLKVTLENRQGLKKYLESIFKREGRKLGSINYVFCTDKALLGINRQFLSHDFYTDILTFDLSNTDSVQAEIYISVDRVRENAGQLGISLKSELHRVIFHGVLHLCGFKDKKKGENQKMRKKEEFYLREYFKL
jgi:rRNA maturation RNase YbeY